MVLFFWVVASSGVVSGREIPRAVARTDSVEYLVGDPIRVSVEITHSSGTTFQSLLGDTIGGYSGHQYGPGHGPSDCLASVYFCDRSQQGTEQG